MRKLVNAEADLDNLDVHVCLALAEYQPMLNLLQVIQQLAKMDGSLEPMMKYHHLRCYLAAAATAQRLVWKRVGLTLIRYPGTLLGTPEKQGCRLCHRRGTLLR